VALGAVLALGGGLISSLGAAPGAAAIVELFTTQTTLSVPNPTPVSVDNMVVPVTATVTIADLRGALITPSGQVAFSVSTSTPGASFDLGGGTLSNCLLGLPSLLGIWQETCSTTFDVPDAALDNCGFTVVTGSYSGATDLVAGPSSGTVTVAGSGCGAPGD
jgi:hypothetical protein